MSTPREILSPVQRERRATVAVVPLVSLSIAATLGALAGPRPMALVTAAAFALLLLTPWLTRLHLAGLQLAGPHELIASAGTPTRLNLTIFNRARRTARDVRIVVEETRRGGAVTAAVVHCVRAGLQAEVVARPSFAQRGRFEGIRIQLRSSWPLGLFEERRTFELPCDLVVLPRVRAVRPPASLLAGLGRELALTRQREAHEGEVFGVREWREGESLRRVHWGLSARRGRRLVRDLRPDSAPQLSIWLVESVGVVPATGRVSTFEDAVSIAAGLALHFSRRGLRVELGALGEVARSLGIAQGRTNCLALFIALAELRPRSGSPARALDQLPARSPGALQLVVSNTLIEGAPPHVRILTPHAEAPLEATA